MAQDNNINNDGNNAPAPAQNVDNGLSKNASLYEDNPQEQAQLARENAIDKKQQQLQKQKMAAKAVKHSARAVEYAGKGVKNVGKGIGKVGDALNRTAVGAVIGAPLKVLGMGVEKTGQAGEKIANKVKKGAKRAEDNLEEKKRQLNKEKFEQKKQQKESSNLAIRLKDKALETASKARLALAFKALYTMYFVPALFYLHLHAFLHAIGFKKTFTKIPILQKIQFGIATAILGAIILGVFVIIDYMTTTSAWQKAKDAAGIIIE